MAIVTLALTVVTTLDAVAPAGTNAATATLINRFCNNTVIYCTPTADGQGLLLPTPSNSSVGDIIECHLSVLNQSGLWFLWFYPQSPDSIFNNGTGAGIGLMIPIRAKPVIFRRLTTTSWGAIY